MSKIAVTNFSNRARSPFKKEMNNETKIVHQEVLQNKLGKQKEKQNELLQKVNKKTAEYQAHKPSSGVFTEVVTHGAFTVKSAGKDKEKIENAAHKNGSNGSKLLGFPSSANDLALDAKSDLESDKNISTEVKEKVIEKLFALVSMVQHTYESKVRTMTEFEKFKDVHLKNEARREREHSEQLYKLNMNFQNEVVQVIQRLRSEIDISRNTSNNLNTNRNEGFVKDTSMEFKTENEQDDGKSSTGSDVNGEDHDENSANNNNHISNDVE